MLTNYDNLIMESIIYSFINNYLLLKLFVYVRQEGPKGELGLIICTNNINKLYRLKIRSPD
jgi:NADH:ubiquinone oxidoreductase subunit D